jgi:hypothetical protein
LLRDLAVAASVILLRAPVQAPVAAWVIFFRALVRAFVEHFTAEALPIGKRVTHLVKDFSNFCARHTQVPPPLGKR